MAGSYNHAVEKPSGKLLVNEHMVGMIENGGDMYEAIQEMYGMIWWLANGYFSELSAPLKWSREETLQGTAELVEEARQKYKQGLEASPGIDGHYPEDDD